MADLSCEGTHEYGVLVVGEEMVHRGRMWGHGLERGVVPGVKESGV
jgi:hypothetical protein